MKRIIDAFEWLQETKRTEGRLYLRMFSKWVTAPLERIFAILKDDDKADGAQIEKMIKEEAPYFLRELANEIEKLAGVKNSNPLAIKIREDIPQGEIDKFREEFEKWRQGNGDFVILPANDIEVQNERENSVQSENVE